MIALQVPQISISFAPEDYPIQEKSPISFVISPTMATHPDDESYRSQHLTPPPTVSPRFFKQASSPLRPADDKAGKGLEKERFEALLRSTRERSASISTGAKQADLRKEVALKAHKTKQIERRALFLSKVMAPPSPSATTIPKTPPESPAIFHYTLPSPGLVSPLALFESLSNQGRPSSQQWVEQVDFRRRDTKSKYQAQDASPIPHSPGRAKYAAPLPTLDEISARIHSQKKAVTTHPAITVTVDSETAPLRKASIRLPAFLQRSASKSDLPVCEHSVYGLRPANSVKVVLPPRNDSKNHRLLAPKPQTLLPPPSPMSPLSPQLQVTTLKVPRTSTTSPVELSETNVHALASRERSSKNMMTTLRRRSAQFTMVSDYGDYPAAPVQSPPQRHQVVFGGDPVSPRARKWKRHSAPAQLQTCAGNEFSHPVLHVRGGF
jgi:hypothetical protein